MITKYLGNVKVHVTTATEALDMITEVFQKKKKCRLFFLNAYCYIMAQKNHQYRKHLNNAELVLNDGIGIEIAAKNFGFQFQQNLNGTDFIPLLLQQAQKNKWRVFLLGGQDGVAAKASQNMKLTYPSISIAGYHHGYFQKDEDIIDTINRAKADIVIVALGVPYQEEWIANHYDRIHANLFLGVGAFLDIAAERVQRAPAILRKYRMEWVYRLSHEPLRLWKRTILGSVLLLYYLLKNKHKKF